MLLIKGEPDLTAHEGKASTEFQKELLEMVDDAAFQLTLGVFGKLRQAEKFQDVGVLDSVLGVFHLLTLEMEINS